MQGPGSDAKQRDSTEEPWLPRAALMWMPALGQAMATALQLMAGRAALRRSHGLHGSLGVLLGAFNPKASFLRQG